MDTFFDLFTRPDFQIGFAAGFGASAILASLFATKKPSGRLAGALAVGVLLIALVLETNPTPGLVGGTIALAFAGLIWRRSRISAITGALVGATLVIYQGGIKDSAAVWVRPLGFAMILIVAWRMTTYEDQGNRPASVLLIALTLLAIWANVPDTRFPRLFLGGWSGLLPGLVVAGLPKLGPWAPAIAGQLVWMVATGGAGRSGSIIGGWASLGILLLRPAASVKPWQAFLVHAGLIAVTARVAGLRESPLEAITISIAAMAVAAALLRGASPPATSDSIMFARRVRNVVGDRDP